MAYYRKRGKTWRVEIERNGIRESESFASKGQAQAWASKREGEILDGDRTSVPNLRMANLFQRYAKEVSPSKKGAKWEKVRLDLLGRDRIAQVRLRDLSAAHLSDWQKRRLEAVSGASVRRERNLLNNALEIARKEWGWVRQNPLEKIRRPKDGQPKERVATDEEIGRISGVASEGMQKVIAFALETGMRASEIAGINSESILGGVVRLRDTKNGTSRVVPLSEKAIEVLRGLRCDSASSDGNADENGETKDKPCNGMKERIARTAAPTLFGLTAGSISGLFARYCKQLGIEGLTFHCLRRTAATRLAKKLTVWELCSMFGWKDPKIPMRHYYKADPDEIARKLT